MRRVEERAAEIAEAYKPIDEEPFPYDDCWQLRRTVNDASIEFLTPDLDLHFSNVASHAIGIDRVIKWPATRAAESRRTLARSFFERHPKYERLRPLITPEATPKLHRHIEATEPVRKLLLDLLEEIETREAADVKS
jgi:hypothetical protein